MTTAEHEDMQSIVVTLRASDDFTFHQTKHTEVFQNYVVKTILGKQELIVNNQKSSSPGVKAPGLLYDISSIRIRHSFRIRHNSQIRLRPNIRLRKSFPPVPGGTGPR